MRHVSNHMEGAEAMGEGRVAYWVSTLFFAAFMGYDSQTLLTGNTRMMAEFAYLGYPPCFALILGVAEILGVLALLVPGTPRLKEWAYSGFTFMFFGAILSQLAAGQRMEAVVPFAALAVMAVSYLMRPPLRRILEAAAAVR